MKGIKVMDWTDQYYDETNRTKRKKILDEAIRDEGLTKENELRVQLYEKRYGDSEEKKREVDYFIRGWMTLEYTKPQKGLWKSSKIVKKDAKNLMDDWQYELVKSYGEIGEEIIYREYCNLVKLYMELCERDKSYSSVLFGIGKISPEKFRKKLMENIVRVSRVSPKILGLEKETELFSKAAAFVFCSQYPNEEEAFEEYVKEVVEKSN